MIRILIVEDEQPIANLIDWNLTDCGYSCRKAYDGLTAADLILENTYDLILLDIMLPGVDGYSLLEQIKPTGTPVIFLTAKGSVADRVRGLRAGADDYLVKPFEIVELLARVETVLRRCGKAERLLTLEPDIEIDPAAREVRKGGRPVELTFKEFELLKLLCARRGVALTRDEILQTVWDYDYTGETRTVDMHVKALRQKLGDDVITTVRGVGYKMS